MAVPSKCIDCHRAFREHTFTKIGQKAMGILFEGGRPYILSNMSQTDILGHHVQLIVAHLR
jgi:hypothetical protein